MEMRAIFTGVYKEHLRWCTRWQSPSEKWLFGKGQGGEDRAGARLAPHAGAGALAQSLG